MSEASFKKAYKTLNKEQKQAVDAIDGPVMVIAGPGTGKTSILTLRIANILKQTDVGPDSILALTFTESGVHSMRRKLVDIIGPAAYRVGIFTFHSFCGEVIRRYPDCFERILGGHLATEVDKIKIVENVIKNGKFPILKLFGSNFFYVRPALQAIQDLKRENTTPKDFRKILASQHEEFESIPDLFHERGKYKGQMKGRYLDLKKKLERNNELGRVYGEYEEVLKNSNLYDYEDLIIEVVKALEKEEDLKLTLQEEYQYILADEHQDANNAQNKILELLSSFHKSPNLFIVGDEKQAIYRFQGASLENLLYFKRKFKNALVINLATNYRSNQAILDASHSLITKSSDSNTQLRLKLKASKKIAGKPIRFYEFESTDIEPVFVVQDILRKIASGISPKDIAVLFRDNSDALPLISAFDKTNIPFAVFSNESVLEDPVIRQYILLLKSVDRFGDDDLLSRLLFSEFLKVSAMDAYKINRYAYTKRVGVSDVLGDNQKLRSAGVRNPRGVIKIFKKMDRWAGFAKSEGLLVAAEKIARESGFLDFVLSRDDSLAGFEKMDALFGQIRSIVETHRNYTLSDFIEYMEVLESHSVRIETPHRPSYREGVSLMTAHRSKGLEFDVVYITGAYEGHWGNRRSRNLFHLLMAGKQSLGFNENDDERRLFYVSLTRAREEVVITSSKYGQDGKPRLPSQFIEEIKSELLEKVPTKKIERKINEDRKSLIHKVPQTGVGVGDKQYLRNLFLDQGLSVTAINNFLECPWKYFFENLIRIPKSPVIHQMYGTAIHESLKMFFDKYKDGFNPKLKDLREIFEKKLAQRPLSQKSFNESLKRGLKSLGGFYDKYKSTWSRAILNELFIPGIYLTTKGGENILLRGVLDKVEFISGAKVRVTDYKTGKPKSRNDILGKTKNSDGNIKRQLDFYKLLLDRFDGGKYKMTEGVIEFIEPNEQGNYRREVFDITSEDAKKAEEIAGTISEQILNLSFWNERCGEKKCQYCALREFIKS
jgi:DNA helicase-2/ATP-dependent DNA helicase PcrA